MKKENRQPRQHTP